PTRQSPRHALVSHNRSDAVRFGHHLRRWLRRGALTPHPAAAVQHRLAVAADRIVRADRTSAGWARNFGAGDVRDAAIAAKHDVLARLELHPADGAAGKLGGHWFTNSMILRPEVYARPESVKRNFLVMSAGVPTPPAAS